jgi:His-Xaa-Ser system radical SAM maturase HxsB
MEHAQFQKKSNPQEKDAGLPVPSKNLRENGGLLSTKPKDDEYIINFHRIKKIKEDILLINEQGAWALMSKKKYESLIRHELDDESKKIFEEKGLIVSRNNINRIIKTEFLRRRFMFHPPVLHIILPTLRCNHRCIYCHSSAKIDTKKEYDMSIETSRKTVEFIMDSPSKAIKIEFQGGESLLNFDVAKEIIHYVKELAEKKEKKVTFSIVSNLTALNEEYLLWLKDHKVRLSTSLDGPKEVHDKNRIYLGGNGTYDDVVRKIEFCRQNGVYVGALMVTTRHSLPMAKEIVDTYLKLGFDHIQLKFINKIGFAENEWNEIGYTPEEYLKFWQESMEYILEKNKEGIFIIERFTHLILQKIFSSDEPGFLDFRNPCGIATGQIAYNYNGDIYCCDEGRGFDVFCLGNVWNMTYHEYVNQNKTQKLVESSILESSYCDTCIFKPYCGQCPVLNYAEQHSLIPKIATNTRCKIMKGIFEWIFQKAVFDESAKKVFNEWLKK